MPHQHHLVFIGDNGRFAKSQTTRADIDALFAHLDQTNARHLALYFHGGLVDEAAGTKTAHRLADRFQNGPAHLISFVWKTGFFEVVGRNLADIGHTALFGQLSEIVTRKVSKYLIVPDGTGRGTTELSEKQVQDELQTTAVPLTHLQVKARGNADQLTESDVDAIEDEFRQELTYEIPPDHPLVDQLEVETTKLNTLHTDEALVTSAGPKPKGLLTPLVVFKLAKASANVIRRYVRKTDHGLWPTIIEELLRQFFLADFGEWVWGNIKTIAEKTMWDAGDESVGGYFLQKLRTYRQAHPDCRLDAIGHSAGSIAVCHLLRAANDLPWHQLIFMAPACTHSLFYDEVVSHPERFAQFRMFTMDDPFETLDSLAGGLYPASLLYLVSGAFEADADTPVLGMQRFLNDVPPYNAVTPMELARVRAFLAADPNRVALAESAVGAGPGFKTMATHHGDFDDDFLTLDSIETLLR